jgi:hypothetical protein
LVLDVSPQTRDEHKVDGAIPHHLVSDVDISAFRIPSLWCHFPRV